MHFRLFIKYAYSYIKINDNDILEYDTFCGAIDKLEAELKNSGAKKTGETLKINILDHDIPEDPAEEWLGSWINLLK